MQRNFSNRGAAHAEAVAAKMSASHKPLCGPESGRPLRRKMSEAWQAPASRVLPTKQAKKREADTTEKKGFSELEL